MKCKKCKSKKLSCEYSNGVYRFECESCGLYWFCKAIKEIKEKEEKSLTMNGKKYINKGKNKTWEVIK